MVKLGTFTVPVDFDVLKACRISKGYKSARKFEAELHRLGYCFKYRALEQPDPKRADGGKNIKSEIADIIADVLGLEPDVVFPRYYEAKAATEEAQAKGRYKPFATLEERDRAILEHYEIARRAAFAFRGILRTPRTGLLLVEMEDLYSLALETLVYEADRAMRIGLKEGYNFTTQVLLAIKTAFMRLGKEEKARKRDLLVHSITQYEDDWHMQIRSGFDLEDYIILLETIEELKRDKKCRKKLEKLGLC